MRKTERFLLQMGDILPSYLPGATGDIVERGVNYDVLIKHDGKEYRFDMEHKTLQWCTPKQMKGLVYGMIQRVCEMMESENAD